MEKREKYMKQTLKNRVKITKALMIAFLINGGFALAESNPSNPITPGTNLGGENATAIGAGSVAAGSESSSVGTNTFASGNNMTKEEYLKFLKDNKERLSKIEAKMQEIKNDKDEIQKLRQEHDDIISKIDRVNSYKKAIEDKEKELNEKEPQILKTIEEKRTEAIKFTKEIDDLEKRIDIISQLDFSKIDENNKAQGVEILAKDLKQKMEDGQTWLKQYGENGIPLEEYKNILINYISYYKYKNIASELKKENFDIDNLEIDRNREKVYIKPAKTNNDNLIQQIRFVIHEQRRPYDHHMYERPFRKFDERYIWNSYYFDLNNNLYSEFDYDKEAEQFDYEKIKNYTFKYNFNDLDDYDVLSFIKSNNPLNLNDFMQSLNSMQNIDNIFNDITFKKALAYDKQIKNNLENISKLIVSTNDDDLLKAKKIQNDNKKIIENASNELGLEIGVLLLENNNIFRDSNINQYKYEEMFSKIKKHISVKELYSNNFLDKELNSLKTQTIPITENVKKLINSYSINYDKNSKLIQIYQDEIDRLKRLEKDANTFITEKEELIKGYKNDIENLKSLLNSEHPSDVEEVNKQIQEKEEKIKKALADIENLKKNLTEIKPGSNALAYGTNSAALGKDSIAFGTNNIAINESSIAFGTNNFVNGDKSIALGYGHKIIGDRSVTLGDPNLIYGDNNFAIGNDIKIGTETQKVNNNLVFGSNVTIDGINNAIVFGNESKPIEGAVSFGNDTTTRKLKYIAKGTDDTDAVNFSQLKDYVKKNAKGKTVNIKNELISKLNYDPDTYLKIDESYLKYISGKTENPKILAPKKLSLNIDGVKDALGKDSDIANPINKFVTDQKVHDYVTENFVSKDSLGVTSKNNYISVNTNGNKYELSFNKDELIKNLDLTKNNTITTINTTLDDKLDKADLSITGDKYIGVKKDNKFNYTLSFNKTNLEKDLDLTNNSSINNMFTTKLGDINTNIGDLKTKVESNTNNINSLTTKVDDNSNKISDLTTKVETNTNNINSLTTKVNTNTKDITTLKKDMTNKLNVDADNLTTQGETNLINKLSKGSDISKPNNRLVTDTKVKQYLDTNFKIQNYVVAKEVLDIKKDAIAANEKAGLALGGVANAIAMANLTTTESGIANLTAAYGTYGKEHALAIGFNGTIPNKRFNYKLGLSTNMKGNLGIGAGIGIVLGKIDAQINKNINSKEIEQNKKIKDLEEKLKYMTDKLNDLTNKINDINFNENKKVETKPTKEETKETKLVIDDFDFDSYTLKEEQKQKLDKFFEKNDCKEIVIVGYTDNVGTDDYNLKLSEKRAKEVEKYLKMKKDNLEILTLGMGKGESLLKESKNDRRVEIFIQ